MLATEERNVLIALLESIARLEWILFSRISFVPSREYFSSTAPTATIRYYFDKRRTSNATKTKFASLTTD